MSTRVADGLGLIARLVLGGVFLVAGGLKVTTPEAWPRPRRPTRSCRTTSPPTSATPCPRSRSSSACCSSSASSPGRRPSITSLLLVVVHRRHRPGLGPRPHHRLRLLRRRRHGQRRRDVLPAAHPRGPRPARLRPLAVAGAPPPASPSTGRSSARPADPTDRPTPRRPSTMAKKPTAATSARQAKIDAVRKDTGGGANRIVVGRRRRHRRDRRRRRRASSSPSATSRSGSGRAPPCPRGRPAHGRGLRRQHRTSPLVAGAPTLEVYEDFQCPACAQFEQVMGPHRQRARRRRARSGSSTTSRPSSTPTSRTTHSLTMGNAAMCAADAGKFQAFHDAVYANMPAQEGQGWTHGADQGLRRGRRHHRRRARRLADLRRRADVRRLRRVHRGVVGQGRHQLDPDGRARRRDARPQRRAATRPASRPRSRQPPSDPRRRSRAPPPGSSTSARCRSAATPCASCSASSWRSG